MRHDGFAGGYVHHVSSQPDNTPGRYFKFEVHQISFRFHDQHFSLSLADGFDDLTANFLGGVDGQLLDRFIPGSVDFLVEDDWFAYLQFVPFSPHGFDQYAEMHHATTKNLERIG